MYKADEIRNQVFFGDCCEVLKNIESNSVTACVTDPPYALDNKQPDIRKVLTGWLAGEDVKVNDKDFMGKEWQLPGPKVWEEVMRVMKPGAHIFSFGGTRTYDLMVLAMRLAGAEVRDKVDFYCEMEQALSWVHGQGFPKSLDISKAMDKGAGVDVEKEVEIQSYLRQRREELGLSLSEVDKAVFGGTTRYTWVEGRSGKRSDERYLPTPEEWERLKAFLKLDSRYDDYIRAVIPSRENRSRADGGKAIQVSQEEGDWGYQQNGERWDGKKKITAPATDEAKKWEGYGTALKPAHEPIACFAKGEAEALNPDVPFLYTAKTSTRERNLGCRHLYWVGEGDILKPIERDEYKRLREENEKRKGEEGFMPHRVVHGNPHPTVKPIELMRYLVKMVKMPGDNLILDPFCGSGSTLIACALEKCAFVGIDADPVSVKVATARAHYFRCLGEKGLR